MLPHLVFSHSHELICLFIISISSVRVLCNMFWLYSLPPTLPRSNLLLHSSKFVCFICLFVFQIHPNKFVLPKYYWIYGLPVVLDQLSRGYTLRENWLPQYQLLTVANSSTHRVGVYAQLSCTRWYLVLIELPQALCILSHPLWFYMCTCPTVSKRIWFLVVVHFLWLL